MLTKGFCSLLLASMLFIVFTQGNTQEIKEVNYSTGRIEVPSSLADNPTKRNQLKYLVSCALAEETEAYTIVDSEEYTFEGDIGLAPHWIDRGLTPKEERWVSACILARTNFFGKTVQISMRLPEGIEISSAFEVTSEELEEYSIFEGGFFGNIFAENSGAYTCFGNRTEKENADPILQDRVCTEETNTLNSEESVSHCGFIITGQCSNPEGFKIGEEIYEEVIFVYLKPEK